MRAVILAGGKGTRLRPYTTNIPKPMVPLGEMAIMEVVLRQLAASGCQKVTVAVNRLAQLIMAYFGDGSKWGLEIDYSVEDSPLGTIGPLKLLPNLPDDFLVMNGDILTDLDFGKFFQAHLGSGAMATIATYERNVNIDFGVLKFREDHRIVEFVEKPTEQFCVSMGIYAFSRRILEFVPENQQFGFDHLMLTMIERGLDVRAYPYHGYWLDIGRPDDYDRANEEFERLRDRLLPPLHGNRPQPS